MAVIEMSSYSGIYKIVEAVAAECGGRVTANDIEDTEAFSEWWDEMIRNNYETFYIGSDYRKEFEQEHGVKLPKEIKDIDDLASYPDPEDCSWPEFLGPTDMQLLDIDSQINSAISDYEREMDEENEEE